jgi:hypothetical protein
MKRNGQKRITISLNSAPSDGKIAVAPLALVHELRRRRASVTRRSPAPLPRGRQFAELPFRVGPNILQIAIRIGTSAQRSDCKSVRVFEQLPRGLFENSAMRNRWLRLPGGQFSPFFFQISHVPKSGFSVCLEPLRRPLGSSLCLSYSLEYMNGQHYDRKRPGQG